MNNDDIKLQELFREAEFDEIESFRNDKFSEELKFALNKAKKRRGLLLEAAQYFGLSIFLAFALMLATGAIGFKIPDLNNFVSKLPHLRPDVIIFGIIALVSISAYTIANQD